MSLLECSINGVDITLRPTPGSLLAQLHRTERTVVERTTCNYGLEPTMRHVVEAGGMRVGAIDELGEVRATERPDHPFFVATLYQPQLSSSAEEPHPIFTGLLKAASA